MKLTQKVIEGLALPISKTEHIFFDDDIAGFGLRIREGGSRNWIFQYKLGTKQRRVTIGSVKALRADKARDRAADFHAMVRLGRDPAGEKAENRTRAAETFEALHKQFLAFQKHRGRKRPLKPRSYEEVERHLAVHAKPLHGLQLAKIKRQTITGRLDEIAQSSGPFAANRVRASLSAFFAWAIRKGLAESNPVIGTDRFGEDARDRVLTESELREIWKALEHDHYGDIVRLLLLTAQRRDEIGGLQRSEIDFVDEAILLPPGRTKNRREHIVPISPLAKAILTAQPLRSNGHGGERGLIFGEGQGGFQGWSNAKAALDKRILEARRADADDPARVKSMAPWRLHDLRRTAATCMADKLGVQPHIIEAVLNHVSAAHTGSGKGHKAGVAGTYNKAQYFAEKRAALHIWSDYLLSIVGGGERKIVPFERRA